ncbi:MAG: NfeD family protein [Chloroflexi bacterium]|nr:NfeD family protein [Chloroflexota bacterium]
MTGVFESYALWSLWIIFILSFVFFLVMAPCHAIFLSPLVGLPLFWLLPLGQALPVNFVIWLTSAFLYRVIMRAMKKPPVDDFRRLVGTRARVESRPDSSRLARYLVRSQGRGELWSAYCKDTLQQGEWVNIVSVRGISLVVERGENGSGPDEVGDVKAILGTGDNGRPCH